MKSMLKKIKKIAIFRKIRLSKEEGENEKSDRKKKNVMFSI